MNNRQVILYDKREEVQKRGKVQWWPIWNRTLRAMGRPALVPKDPKAIRVWRIEVRAGKKLLKDRWQIRTFAEFYARFGDMTRETVRVIRYATPCPTDQNRARWPDHPIWKTVTKALEGDLLDMCSNAEPATTKEVKREQHISVLLRNILGCSITHAALYDCPIDDLPDFLTGSARDMADVIGKNPAKYAKMLENAKGRYRFI